MTKITIDVDDDRMEGWIMSRRNLSVVETLVLEAYKAQRPSKVDRCMVEMLGKLERNELFGSSMRAILTKYMGEK